MHSSVHPQPEPGLELEGQPRFSVVEGWTVREYATVSSTNLMAANLPVWEAVRADTQTAGRGRFQRQWVSDEGGLWLTAVVPAKPVAATLPLVAGLAVCNALQEVGVESPRLRWPNDVLVQDRKLAGLLVDQFTPGLAVVGVGVNVRNQPELRDPSLNHHTMRLADLLSSPPGLGELTTLLLRNLRRVVNEWEAAGFNALLSRVNQFWGLARQVELDLDGVIRRGLFSGVDEHGRLILLEASGSRATYAAHQVRHLKEI